jgi:hypothetical protein
MLSFIERLELLEQDLKATPPAFTMATDLPFAIFRYDPTSPGEGEWFVRQQIHHLATRVHLATSKTIHIVSLAKLYWQSIAESEGIEALVALERERGFRVAEEQVNTYLSDPDWRPLPDLLVACARGMRPEADILFLVRAGVFAPASYRISSLMEQLMGRLHIPAVLFYPGTWRGSLNYMGLRRDDEPLGSYRVKIYGRES